MKKIFLSALIFSISVSISCACDFCNCYLGLNPHFKKNSIGVRYHYTNYTGTHMDDSELSETNLSKNDFWERRNSIEMHGQWYLTQKLKLLFSAAYVVNSEGLNAGAEKKQSMGSDMEIPSGTETIKGFGDPFVIAHYELFNKNGDSANFSQRLLAGGGIKFPMGKWKLEEGAEANERIHLPGTGSWDLIVSAEYLAKYKRVGVNVNVSYLLTTVNNQSFQFANRFNANAVCYYQVNIKTVSFYPSLGIFLEQAGEDKYHHVALQNSGGTILYGHAGMDFYFKNFSLNTALQLPAVERLNNPQPEMNFRIIAGITYAFN